MKKNKFFTFTRLVALFGIVLLSVVLLSCPVAAPKEKDKGGDDDEGEKPYVCPALTVSPANNAALQTLVDAAITVGNPSPDLNHIDVSGVTDMAGIFNGKTNFNGNVSCWDTSSATDMNSMFSGTNAFNGDISKWKTGKVTDIRLMFNSASVFNGDISGWDTGIATLMTGMFFQAGTFNQDLSGWDVGKVTAHGAFASLSGFKDDTAKHPKWCDNAKGNRNENCANVNAD